LTNEESGAKVDDRVGSLQDLKDNRKEVTAFSDRKDSRRTEYLYRR
jgi:hypothetical protein